MGVYLNNFCGVKLVCTVAFVSVIILAHEARLVDSESLPILRMLKIFLKQNLIIPGQILPHTTLDTRIGIEMS